MIEAVVSGLIVGTIIVFAGWILVVKTARYQIRHFKKALREENVLPDLEGLVKRAEGALDVKIQGVKDDVYNGIDDIITNRIKPMANEAMVVLDTKMNEMYETIIEEAKEAVPVIGEQIKISIQESLGSIAGQVKQVMSVKSRADKKEASEMQDAMIKGMIDQKFPGAGAIVDSLPEGTLDLAKDNPQLVAMLMDRFGGGGGNSPQRQGGGGKIPKW